MRARLIGGLPADLVGSLTGLTQGHFPVSAKATYADDLSERQINAKIARGRNAAMPIEANTSRRGINIYAKAGSAAIATQDGRVIKIGKTKRLGQFIQIQDVYGNTYTYAQLKKVAVAYAVPKAEKVSKAQVAKELGLPKKDPKPTQAASAGSQPKAAGRPRSAPRRPPAAAHGRQLEGRRSSAPRSVNVQQGARVRQPVAPASYKQGGEEQLLNREFQAGGTSLPGAVHQGPGPGQQGRHDQEAQGRAPRSWPAPILGRVGKTQKHVASHLLFEIRPAGKGAPRIDPKPILDGWKLLESTAIYRAAGKNPFFGPDAKNPSIGQILLMSKESLQRRVLTDSRIQVYGCGRTRHPRRQHRPPRPGHAGVPLRLGPEAVGHLPGVRPRRR